MEGRRACGGHDAGVSTVVYTDGACLGNPGPGGWAWAIPGGRYASGAAPATTNQRMEIQAALEAITALDGPLEVISDSTYVVHCFRDRWWEGWMRKGWVNSQRKPVANRDLWEPLIEAVRADPGRVRFSWVKGHSENEFNDLVDRLAVEAARTQQSRRGEGPPEFLDEPDKPRARSRSAGVAGGGAAPTAPPGSLSSLPDPPEGHRLVVAGHRPPALGGYGDNPTVRHVRQQLAGILEAKRSLQPDLVVLTGMGLGAEQLGAEAAVDAGVPYVVVLPYPEMDKVWSADVRERFQKLLAGARQQVVMQDHPPETKHKAGAALTRRDAWLARHASEAIVVWDGADEMIGKTVRSLQDHLGETEVWVVEPQR